jgi:hypothetical protein
MKEPSQRGADLTAIWWISKSLLRNISATDPMAPQRRRRTLKEGEEWPPLASLQNCDDCVPLHPISPLLLGSVLMIEKHVVQLCFFGAAS